MIELHEEFSTLPDDQQRVVCELFMFLIHNENDWQGILAEYVPQISSESKECETVKLLLKYIDSPSETLENSIGKALTGYENWYLVLTK